LKVPEQIVDAVRYGGYDGDMLLKIAILSANRQADLAFRLISFMFK